MVEIGTDAGGGAVSEDVLDEAARFEQRVRHVGIGGVLPGIRRPPKGC